MLRPDIHETIRILRDRPRMIFSNDEPLNFTSYKIFVFAFSYGVSSSLDIHLTLNITHWYHKKMKQDSDIFWSDQLYSMNKGKEDAELIKLLLDTFEAYFTENPDWATKK